MARKVNKTKIEAFGKEIQAHEEYYLGNKGLPTEKSEYEWTPEMAAAILRSREDVEYFAETFFTIIDKTIRKHIELRPYQRRILESMQKHNRLVINSSRQIGKCVDYDTKIKIRCKWLPFLHFTIKIGTLYSIASFFRNIKSKIFRSHSYSK